MLKHAGCGGELKKFRRTNLYRCAGCTGVVRLGSDKPRGVNHSRDRAAGVRTYYAIPYASDRSELVALHSIIANGGKVLVVGGQMNQGWRAYENHPQIVFWCGSQSEIARHLKNGNNFPTNVHAVIMSRFISHSESNKITEEARRKRCTIMVNKNDGEITEILDEITRTPIAKPPSSEPLPAPKPAQQPMPKFKNLREMVQYLMDPDLKISLKEEGLRLSKISQELGLGGTPESVRKVVSEVRQALGLSTKRLRRSPERKPKNTPPETKVVRTLEEIAALPEAEPKHSRPKPLTPNSEIIEILKFIDDAMAGLQLAKDAVEKMATQNVEYQEMKRTFAKFFKD